MNVQDTVKEWATAVLAGDKEGERLLELNGSPMWENGERLRPLLKQSIENTTSLYSGEWNGSYTTGELNLGGGHRGKIVISLAKDQSDWQVDDDGHFVIDSDKKNRHWQITDATDEAGKSLITGDTAADDPPDGYGRVVDLQRRPIAGAKVSSIKSNWSAQTGADGTFLWQDRAELREVRVHAAGFLDRQAYMPDIRNRRVIHIQRGCRLEGLVLGTNGKPQAGASIGIENYPAYEGYSESYHGAATSDRLGRFTINNIPPEKSLICVVYGGSIHFGARSDPLAKPGDDLPPADQPAEAATAGTVLELKDGQDVRDLVLDMSQSTAVAIGRVVDKNGKPVRGADVHLVQKWTAQSFDETLYQFNSVMSGAEGRYRLTRLPHGPWMISATIRNANAEPDISPTIRQAGRGR